VKRRLFAAVVALVVLAGADGRSVLADNVRTPYFLAQVATYYRTELYFGRTIPGGGAVSDAEWEKFLADVVTPRFPDGFTVLKASGHYREQTGKIITEPSEVIVFLYPANRRTSSRRKIEEIRRVYVRQFKQESVLRLDFRSPVTVLF
jgi:hypothetical protein